MEEPRVRGLSSIFKSKKPADRGGKPERKAPGRDDADIFFDEVSEELQRERMMHYGRKYGPMLGGAVAAILIGAFGYEFYASSVRDAQREAGGKLLATQSRTAPAPAAEVEKLAAGFDGNLAVLARLQAAGRFVDGKGSDDDPARAIELYKSVAATPELAPVYADLARVRGALVGAETMEPAALLDLLRPATAEGRPYRPVALELTAAAHVRAKDLPKARAALELASKDAVATPALRGRAATLMAAIDDQLATAKKAAAAAEKAAKKAVEKKAEPTTPSAPADGAKPEAATKTGSDG
ncbi:MAG: tetratricopeptide repeat protein [Neomegalonema sp.]|nr:tetratricopeptide repeat protein [Neomegalonema sp.]